jgi:hypothetical protein
MFMEEEVRRMIKEEAYQFGSQKDLAEEWDLSTGYISQVLTGKRPVTDYIANMFGLKRIPVFVPLSGEERNMEPKKAR